MKRFLIWSLRVVAALCALALALVLGAWVAYRLADRTNGSLESGGESRSYLLYVPESYDPSTPAPLVISLHGFAQWPAHQSALTGWKELADEYGFILVHPSGTGFPKRWRTQLQGAEQSPDVTFISDLIDQLESEYQIDPERIYVNGLSNGGGMTALLACELGDRIAAMGSVAGAYSFPWSACESARPMPGMIFHGTGDPIVPYQGGPGGDGRSSLPAVPAWVDGLAGHNGCDLTPVEIPAQGEVSEVRYEGCAGDAEVVFYTIADGGHSWPGGGWLPRFLVGHTTDEVDATREMWEFFQEHRLH
jgi:polyhydroxybutyrate depolymerase